MSLPKFSCTSVLTRSPKCLGVRAVLMLCLVSSASLAQETHDDENESQREGFFLSTTVTATLHETDVFDLPMSVTVIEDLESRPANNAADLLVHEAGVDVNGVGANQSRPVIRGQRGLRVLFLEDGLSLNNPRRQSDFGEITGLSDLDQMERVEVVRGPSSVLYGNGAIGGCSTSSHGFPGPQMRRCVSVLEPGFLLPMSKRSSPGRSQATVEATAISFKAPCARRRIGSLPLDRLARFG